MRNKIDSFNVAAATTEGGNWMLKALHPAEPSLAAVAMPDGTAYDTVPVELTFTRTIGPDLLGPIPSNWGVDAVLMPHPTCPFVAIPTGGAGALIDSVDMRVPMFSGTTFNDDLGLLAAIAQAWRLCGLSLTLHLDANATKDSGTVVAAQMVTKTDSILFEGCTALGQSHPPTVVFDANDKATYDQLMALPRAYQANVRTGLYMPLKLTNTSQHWFGARDRVGIAAASNITYGTSAVGDMVLGTPTTVAWPFYHLSPMHAQTITGAVEGGNTSCFLGDNFGHISVTGLDPSSSIVIKVRLLLELKVQAQSTYAAHLRPPPMCDNLAIANYFKIVRELPDAYPADYNDNGRILSVISGVIKKIAPFLSAIPGYGPLIAGAAGPVTGLLDMGAARLAQRGPRQTKRKQKSRQQEIVVRQAPIPPPKPSFLKKPLKYRIVTK